MSASYRKVLLGSGAKVKGWILEYDPAFTNTSGIHSKGLSQVRAADDTDEGNMFFAATAADTTNGSVVARFNKDGEILSEVKLAGSRAHVNIAMAVDTSDNVFIADRQDSKVCITKLNSSLTLQQTQTYLCSSAAPDSNVPIACRGTDIYVGANMSDLSTSQRSQAFRVNASNLSVANDPRVVSGGGEGPQCMHIDSNGQAYIGGQFRPAGDSGFSFLPLNANMSTDFFRMTNQINGSTAIGGKCLDITTDSSGNIYVAGYQESNATNTSKNTYMKFNSTGTLQWSRVFNCPTNPGFFGGNNSESGNLVHMTDAGLVSIYYGNNGSTSEIYINLWNPSTGAIITSYKVRNQTNSWDKTPVNTQGHVFTTEEHVYVQTTADDKVYVLKLPIENVGAVFGSYTIGGNTVIIANGGGTSTALTHTFFTNGASTGNQQTISAQSQNFFSTSTVSKNTNLTEI